ncbi:MAG: tryptophan synthase subunit alpha, partial [Candidatus Geothermincolia bacterium]
MTIDNSRLERMFSGLKGRRSALIAYATGFYPDRDRSVKVIRTMLDNGADAVEIGVPFSDPVMDGPVIQAASETALLRGATPAGVIDVAAEVRGYTDRPLLLMTYYNPVFKFGLSEFVKRAAEAGVDGLIVPDLPAEEMGPLKAECDASGVSIVPFCSTTT